MLNAPPPFTMTTKESVVGQKLGLTEEKKARIEITRQLAMKFFNDEMSMDEWLSRFYPKQMTVYHKAISLARSQLLGM